MLTASLFLFPFILRIDRDAVGPQQILKVVRAFLVVEVEAFRGPVGHVAGDASFVGEVDIFVVFYLLVTGDTGIGCLRFGGVG